MMKNFLNCGLGESGTANFFDIFTRMSGLFPASMWLKLKDLLNCIRPYHVENVKVDFYVKMMKFYSGSNSSKEKMFDGRRVVKRHSRRFNYPSLR